MEVFKVGRKKENNLSLINSTETMEKATYGISFSKTQHIECKGNINYLEEYEDFIKDMNFSERINLLLNSTGISSDNLFYTKMISLMKLLILLEENLGIFLVGEKCMAKSSTYSMIFDDLCFVKSNLPTRPWLQGNANKDVENETKIPLEENVIIFEEVANNTESEVKEIVEYLKEIIESGKFLKNNKQSTETKTSFAIIGNNDSSFKNLEDLGRYKLLKHLPKTIYENEALFDRFPFIFPHYSAILGEIKFTENNIDIIPIKILEKIIKELRKKEIFSNLSLTEIDKAKLEGRNRKIIAKVISMFTKLLFPEKLEKLNLDDWFVKGITEIILHFRSLTSNKVYIPFNKDSATFILYFLGFDINQIDWILFDKERIIVKKLGENFISKIALTEYGVKQNEKEYNFYFENPQYKNEIMRIISIEENKKILKQEIGNYYSKKVIYYIKSYNPEDISSEEKNKQIIQDIQDSVDRTRQIEWIEEFIGIPNFMLKEAEKISKAIFNPINKKISRRNIVLIDGDIKFLNFSELIEEKKTM